MDSVKSLQPTDQPFLLNANILYTTQKWFSNRMVSPVATRDWAFGAFLQYGSGLPLTPPAATNTNYIGGSGEQFRVTQLRGRMCLECQREAKKILSRKTGLQTELLFPVDGAAFLPGLAESCST